MRCECVNEQGVACGVSCTRKVIWEQKNCSGVLQGLGPGIWHEGVALVVFKVVKIVFNRIFADASTYLWFFC
jgi:hypothetical protein